MYNGPITEEYLNLYFTPQSKVKNRKNTYNEIDVLTAGVSEYQQMIDTLKMEGGKRPGKELSNAIAYLQWRMYMKNEFDQLKKRTFDRAVKVPGLVHDPNTGANYLPGVSQPIPQSSGMGCWSVALQNLLKSRGVSISQEAIRAYYPYFSRAYLESQKKSKNAPDELTDYDEVLNSCFRDSMGNPIDRVELVRTVLPNTAFRQAVLRVPANISADEMKKAKDDMFDRICGILSNNKSPVAVNLGNHYITVFGYEGNMLLYKDSDVSKPEDADIMHRMTIDNLFQYHINMGKDSLEIDISFLEEPMQKKAPDGSVYYGFAGDDGIRYDENGTRTLNNQDYADVVNELRNAKDDENKNYGQVIGQKSEMFTRQIGDYGQVHWLERICPPAQMKQLQEVEYRPDLVTINEMRPGMVIPEVKREEPVIAPEAPKQAEQEAPKQAEQEALKQAEPEAPENFISMKIKGKTILLTEETQGYIVQTVELNKEYRDLRNKKIEGKAANRLTDAYQAIVVQNKDALKKLAVQLENARGAFTRSSDEFVNMQKALGHLNAVIAKGEALKNVNDYERLKILNEVQQLMITSQKQVGEYVAHTMRKPRTGAVREERLKLTDELSRTLLKMAKGFGDSTFKQEILEQRRRRRANRVIKPLTGLMELQAELTQEKEKGDWLSEIAADAYDSMNFVFETVNEYVVQEGGYSDNPMLDERHKDLNTEREDVEWPGFECHGSLAHVFAYQLAKRNPQLRNLEKSVFLELVAGLPYVREFHEDFNESYDGFKEFAEYMTHADFPIAQEQLTEAMNRRKELIVEEDGDYQKLQQVLVDMKSKFKVSTIDDYIPGTSEFGDSRRYREKLQELFDIATKSIENMSNGLENWKRKNLAGGLTYYCHEELGSVIESTVVPCLVIANVLRRESAGKKPGVMQEYLMKCGPQKLIENVSEFATYDKYKHAASSSAKGAIAVFSDGGKRPADAFVNGILPSKKIAELFMEDLVDAVCDQMNPGDNYYVRSMKRKPKEVIHRIGKDPEVKELLRIKTGEVNYLNVDLVLDEMMGNPDTVRLLKEKIDSVKENFYNDRERAQAAAQKAREEAAAREEAEAKAKAEAETKAKAKADASKKDLAVQNENNGPVL